MLSYLHLLFYSMLAALVTSLALPLPAGDIAQRTDVSFNCDCFDHWFKHGRFWIRASSTTGCMSLEMLPKKVYALNAVPKPDFFSKNYPNLICSLIQNKCQWTYSPLDFLNSQENSAPNSTSSDSSNGYLKPRQQSTPACEKLDDARDLLPPVLPFTEGPATPDELELETILAAEDIKHANAKRDDDDKDGENDDSENGDEHGDAETTMPRVKCANCGPNW